jgi:soluble lytic murein transglycosylase
MTRRLLSHGLGLATVGLVALLYLSLLGMRVLWPFDYEEAIRRQADAHGLAPELVASVIYAESRFHSDAVSPRGAIGLMQLMPETAAWIAATLGEPQPSPQDLLEVDLNVRYGAWYLRALLDRFGDTADALAAYNAGPSSVERWAAYGTSAYPETAEFVRRAQAACPIYRFYVRFPVLLRITPTLHF